jgi:hypothetical protein
MLNPQARRLAWGYAQQLPGKLAQQIIVQNL